MSDISNIGASLLEAKVATTSLWCVVDYNYILFLELFARVYFRLRVEGEYHLYNKYLLPWYGNFIIYEIQNSAKYLLNLLINIVDIIVKLFFSTENTVT